MSASDSFQRDQPPVGLSINLSSNNPFRNRAVSPASPFEDPPARPLSRNPFLDQSLPPVRSPGTMSNHSDSKSLSAEEIFNSLTLDDKKGEKKAESSSGNKQGDLLGLGLDISGSKPAPQLSNVMDLGRDQEDQGRHHEDPHHNSAVLDETPNLQSLISMLSP
uniref:Uncharacterized protein n=1 Tax=Bionectria ochroleuca TaxID=29856 RepID=A0A8H7TU36_BIOOC